MSRLAARYAARHHAARHARAGQSTVEYVLAIAVIAIVIAAGFQAFGAGVSGVFHNVRTTVQQPYP